MEHISPIAAGHNMGCEEMRLRTSIPQRRIVIATRQGFLVLLAALAVILGAHGPICCADPPGARSDSVPFATLAAETTHDWRWAANKDPLIRMFNTERDRLGERFDPQLISFVDTNVQRHYWCAAFLTDPGYLQGRPKRPYLGLLLYEQGLLLSYNDEDDSWQQASFRFLLAIQYMRQGFLPLAVHHKRLLKQYIQNCAIRPGLPAIPPQDDAIFEQIPSERPGRGAGRDDNPPTDVRGAPDGASHRVPESDMARNGGSPKPALQRLADAAAEVNAWEKHATALGEVFYQEKLRLGEEFDSALLRFVGRDPTRHYWCGVYLSSPQYMRDQKVEPYLAQLLWEQGLILFTQEAPSPRKEAEYRLHLSFGYARLGLKPLAGYHKRRARELFGSKVTPQGTPPGP